MKTMKRRYWKLTLFFIALFTAGFISSCKKNNGNPSPTVTTSSGIAYVAVTNASPTTIMYSVYADTTNIYPAGTLAYGSTTGILNGNPYETISDSTHSIFLSGNGVRINIDSNMTFQDSSYYSVFVYDTGALK